MRFDSAAVGKFERRRNAWSVNGRINRLSSRLGGTGNSQSFKVSGTRSRDDEIRPDIASLTSLQSRAFSSPRSACHGANVFVIRHAADCEKLRIEYIYIYKNIPLQKIPKNLAWNGILHSYSRNDYFPIFQNVIPLRRKELVVVDRYSYLQF